ncbi:MAG: TIGR00282 family metallophosphoesterase [Pseudomonadota bacterium]
MFKLLFIGDIYGKPGRDYLTSTLPKLISDLNVNFVIANGENAAGGFGITPKVYKQILDSGVNLVTSGNHIDNKKEIYEILNKQDSKLLRPFNFKQGKLPGKGFIELTDDIGNQLAIINMCGALFMKDTTSPFKEFDKIIHLLNKKNKIIIVDFHAEATSEKTAVAYYLDGKISALIGTHTHVQTADERILQGGTAYITDVGMTGPMDSIIGCDTELSLKKFTQKGKFKCIPAKTQCMLNAVIVEIDNKSGKAISIKRINQ